MANLHQPPSAYQILPVWSSARLQDSCAGYVDSHIIIVIKPRLPARPAIHNMCQSLFKQLRPYCPAIFSFLCCCVVIPFYIFLNNKEGKNIGWSQTLLSATTNPNHCGLLYNFSPNRLITPGCFGGQPPSIYPAI